MTTTRCALALFVLLSMPAAAQGDSKRLELALLELRSSELRGPNGQPLFPPDLTIDRVVRESEALHLFLGGDWGDEPAFAKDPALAEVLEELRLESLLGTMSALEIEGGAFIHVRAPDGSYRRLGGTYVHRPPERRASNARPSPKPAPQLPRGGALLGKRIAISAGHGWLANSSGGWYTQRSRWDFTGCGSCRGIIEDFFNAEMVTDHIIPLLEGMGAEVVLVREPDHSIKDPITVDDGEGGYSESGTWIDGSNPGGHGGDYRANAAGGEARFVASFTSPGPRRVSLRYVPGGNRTTGALVEVRHGGGSTLFDLNQQRNGLFWLDLGAFWFPTGTGEVVLTNPGSGYLIADAVKFGGGIWATSGKPWWQMGAVSYVPWAGSTLTSTSDVSIRPLYAEEIGADLYLAIHGNAAGTSPSTATGTSSYRYSCQSYSDHSSSDNAVNCDDPPGSRRALDRIHNAILRRVRADWDPNWRDRGRLVANFGELRNLDDTPGILVETAFFDNQANPAGNPPPKYADNRSMHDPRWRDAVAYGIAEGVAQFFDQSKGPPPGRPDGLRAINNADGSLTVAWNAVADATAYRVFVLENPSPGRERAFDAGQIVSGTEVTVTHLTPRQVYAVRVAGVNANGEGLPSQAVVARFRGATNLPRQAAEALFVGAYDRRDAWVQVIDNDLGYAVEHAQGLAGTRDLFFDGALDEVVEDGTVDLANYQLVDFQAGKDSVEHESISTAMQQLLAAFLAGGGKLLISGEEIGYDLGERGSTDDLAFLRDSLQVTYVADDANTFTINGVQGGPFAGLSGIAFDDGTKGVYEVRYPDVLDATSGSSKVMAYPDGRGAAIASANVIFFGMPLETIVPASARVEVFNRAIAHLQPSLAEGDLDMDGASDECETQYGFDPRDHADGAEDADGDGASNAAECQAGTNPRDGEPPPDAGANPDAGAQPQDAAVVPPAAAEAKADGCGCAAGGAEPSLAALALLALGLVRRNRR
ncbi:MAG: N-acetylmuramoyl-L-alanine amidase [Myxococcales bacterium]